MESFIRIIIIMVCRMVQVSLGINRTRINTKYIPLIIVIVIKLLSGRGLMVGVVCPRVQFMADCIILSSDSEKCISDKDDDLPSFSAFLKTNRAIHSSKSSKTTAQSSRTLCLVDDETESGQSQTLTEEDEEELDPKVSKRRRLEKEKEERKMERERKKAEKQREKTVHKMVSQVSIYA